MELWRANIEEPAVAKRTKNLMEGLRNDLNNVMKAYEMIQGTVGVNEELFQTDYEPKIQQMTVKINKLEEALTRCASEELELRQNRVRNIEPRGEGGERKNQAQLRDEHSGA